MTQFNELLGFLRESVTLFHAVRVMCDLMKLGVKFSSRIRCLPKVT